MDIGLITQIGVAVSSAAAAYTIGRRGVASETVTMLQAQIDVLESRDASKNTEIATLTTKVDILEGLVTQRAAVEEVREIVERIAVKVGA